MTLVLAWLSLSVVSTAAFAMLMHYDRRSDLVRQVHNHPHNRATRCFHHRGHQ